MPPSLSLLLNLNTACSICFWPNWPSQVDQPSPDPCLSRNHASLSRTSASPALQPSVTPTDLSATLLHPVLELLLLASIPIDILFWASPVGGLPPLFSLASSSTVIRRVGTLVPCDLPVPPFLRYLSCPSTHFPIFHAFPAQFIFSIGITDQGL